MGLGVGVVLPLLAFATQTGDPLTDMRWAALAPMFVLADIERFVPAEDTRVTTIFAIVVGGTLALLGLLAVLLVRDKRKSAELQADLVRRRRERRARQAAQGTPSPGQT